MPGVDGMELLHQLSSREVSLPVIMLTGHGDVPMAVEAMKLGAIEFLEKPTEPAKLRAAVLAALALDAARRSDQDECDEIKTLIALLTDREREVLDLLVEGKQARTISTVLGTAHNTVRVHRARIMKKMRADSVADLIRMVHLCR
jgi:FixJ family two-component response regulator